MEHTSLQELLYFLEYGTELHITVVFLENYGNEKTNLDSYFVNHSKPYCEQRKSTPEGLSRCVRCRNRAISRVVETQIPFGGLCDGGVYEYVAPVIYEDVVIAVIFVGNIKDADGFEKNFDEDKCLRISSIVENHIKLLIKEYPKTTGDFNPLIMNIKSYVEESLFGEISVKELARIFNYNEKYIGKLFKEKEGIGIIEYVNRKRLIKAKELLEITSMTVTEIAQQTGFNNVTYFNRLFKKRFGKSPTEYRNKK